MNLQVALNRAQKNWSKKELFVRLLWGLVWPLFRFSPRLCWGWRRWLLRSFGADVGRQVHILPTAVVFIPWNLTIGDQSAIGEHALIYNLGPVVIGRCVTISQQAHLCGGTHDYTDPTMPLLKTPIHIGDDSWVCADAFIGPGVSVGAGAVVGARAVVTKDVPPWVVVAGNPARQIKQRILRATTAESP